MVDQAAVAKPRTRGSIEPPVEHCTDGVAASVTVQGEVVQGEVEAGTCTVNVPRYGLLVAARGEVEASGRGVLHPHILGWALCDILRDKLAEKEAHKEAVEQAEKEAQAMERANQTVLDRRTSHWNKMPVTKASGTFDLERLLQELLQFNIQNKVFYSAFGRSSSG